MASLPLHSSNVFQFTSEELEVTPHFAHPSGVLTSMTIPSLWLVCVSLPRKSISSMVMSPSSNSADQVFDASELAVIEQAHGYLSPPGQKSPLVLTSTSTVNA